MSENSAIEILRGKGWEVEDGSAFKETGFGYRVVFCGAGYPELVHEGEVGGAAPVRECITEADLEALVEATNANREACGRGPLFVSPQQQAAHSFSTEEVRRILLALRFTENGGPWFHHHLRDLIVKAEICTEAATGEKA